MSNSASVLTGVAQTMLWTLHNRAGEAKRADGIIDDPEAVRIYESIDYDFERHFGKADGSHAARSLAIDAAVRRWLDVYPDGLIVSLGEGLETQYQRLENGRLHWLSVDLPEAIAFRERFIVPDDRHRHLAISALDRSWIDAVDTSRAVFIIAQGLFMYFPASDVRDLLVDLADRLPKCELIFDVIPRWFSRLTLRGLRRTRYYKLPPMPWGIDRNEIAATVKTWLPGKASVELLSYQMPRGLARVIDMALRSLPVLANKVPSLVLLRIAKSSDVDHTFKR